MKKRLKKTIQFLKDNNILLSYYPDGRGRGYTMPLDTFEEIEIILTVEENRKQKTGEIMREGKGKGRRGRGKKLSLRKRLGFLENDIIFSLLSKRDLSIMWKSLKAEIGDRNISFERHNDNETKSIKNIMEEKEEEALSKSKKRNRKNKREDI